jgi:hypothetical protein
MEVVGQEPWGLGYAVVESPPYERESGKAPSVWLTPAICSTGPSPRQPLSQRLGTGEVTKSKLSDSEVFRGGGS